MREINGKIMQYHEYDNSGRPTGNSVSFGGVEFEPLEYRDLVNLKHADKVTLRLRWKNAVILESTIPEIDFEKLASGHMTLESPYSSKTIGLIRGGWLPAGMVIHDDTILLPDRCTVSEFIRRFRDGLKRKNDDIDFLDFLAGRHIRINPLLFALEGNIKAKPSREIVKQQLEEVYSKVKDSLPLAELVPDKNSGLEGIIGIINDAQASMLNKQEFLTCIAPKLRSPIGAKRRIGIWNEILTTADTCKVSRQSLVVIAALSAACVLKGKSPARALLKFSVPNYTPAHAYNALSDLRTLEIMMYQFALFPEEHFLLCTGDKNLSLFWCGLRASNFEWRNDKLNFKISPIDELFPGVTREQKLLYFEEK